MSAHASPYSSLVNYSTNTILPLHDKTPSIILCDQSQSFEAKIPAGYYSTNPISGPHT